MRYDNGKLSCLIDCLLIDSCVIVL